MNLNQEVYVVQSYGAVYRDCTYQQGKIVKITSSGQVSVAIKGSDGLEQILRFNKDGREIGVNKHHAKFLEANTNVVEKILNQRAKQREINKQVIAIHDKIKTRQNGMGNYFIDQQTKDELLALVNSLPVQ